MLRLFNDSIAILFAYAAILAMIKQRWILASILYSLGVGVKMNVLLFLPGILYVLIKYQGIAITFFYLTLGFAVQVSR
jgi:alpha-1,3-mannosyltransferase